MKDDTEKKPSWMALATIAAMLVAVAFLKIKQTLDDRRPILARVSVAWQTFRVEVADTSGKMEKGLGLRDSMPADAGMYFSFPSAQYWVFWMKDMRFPIDIVWIRDGKVVDVTAEVPVDKTLPLKTYSPIAPADAVLEINAGAAGKAGVKTGDEVKLGT